MKYTFLKFITLEEKHFTKMIDENKEKELTETMLNLRISQLEKALNKTEDSVFSLEKQKIELETVSSFLAVNIMLTFSLSI